MINYLKKSKYGHFLARIWWAPRIFLRKLVMFFGELQTIFKKNDPSESPRIFNLDLHIGVIADIETGLAEKNVSLTRWSISGHNHLIRRFFGAPDPVAHINAKTWRRLSETSRVEKFKRRYRAFLSKFEGFVATYSPTFAPLFEDVQKPILIVAATRYETPFTANQAAWDSFNSWMISKNESGLLTIAANNRGDADYIQYFTGIKPKLAPSLCNKEGGLWVGGNGKRVVLGRVPLLTDEIVAHTNSYFRPISELGSPYLWQDLLRCEEIFVIPQNISTMTLFEFATAGVPVAVPDRAWMKELRLKHPDILSELSFTQLEGLSTEGMASDNPNNWNSAEFLDWWLDRADFYDATLMPNVRTVSSFEDLSTQRDDVVDRASYIKKIESRNHAVWKQRSQLIDEFLSSVTL